MKHLFSLCALCLITATGAKAGTKEVYTAYDATNQTLTYYYDDQRSVRETAGLTVALYNPDATVRFYPYGENVLKGVIDESMYDAGLTTCKNMFKGAPSTGKLTAMTTIEGLDNLYMDDVTSMEQMFCECSALTSLDLSKWNTDNVQNLNGMFAYCSSLNTVDISNFNIQLATDMASMFFSCTALTTIYCESDWSESIAECGGMFAGCSLLKGSHGTEFSDYNRDNTYARPDRGTSEPGYFTDSEIYTEYNSTTKTLTYFYDHNVASRTGTTEFYTPGTLRFETYYLQIEKAVVDESMKDAYPASLKWMFFGGVDLINGQNYYLMKLATIEGLENLNTTNVLSMEEMFMYCTSLTSLDLSSFNTSDVENMNGMFYLCSRLESVNLIGFDVNNVEDFRLMFSGCNELKTIYCDEDWNSYGNVPESANMFQDCTSLIGGQGTVFISTQTNIAYAHVDGGTANPGYFTKEVPTGNTEIQNDQRQSVKTIRDNRFLIINNGKTYNALGIEVE